MGFNFDISVPVMTVFAQGLLSFLSPCVLPLLPVYIGYLAGDAIRTLPDGTKEYDRKRVMLHTLLFVLGVSFAFFLLGMGMSAIGLFFNQNRRAFAIGGGILIVLFGLYQLGLFGQIRFFSREHRLPVDLAKFAPGGDTSARNAAVQDGASAEETAVQNKTPAGKELRACLRAMVFGFLFSFAWTPCVGPVLTSVLLMAGASSDSAYGFLLIGVYTLGFCIPFLLTGLFTTTLLNFFRQHRNVVQYTAKAGAVLMIVAGILMITGYMNRISTLLSL
ncbi:MAG: hypothetical protein IK016_02425 [Lachnospiraceae bacterium]|nr:hypothetical protein [Lachnospiraceae bacterium]